MYCWKCGKELVDASHTCVYCGVEQTRSEPLSDAGKALRKLYDHFGRDAVLTNNAILVNGLSDLVEDSQKLRGQLRIALEAGMGRLYIDRLTVEGQPDANFDTRVKNLLTDEAGLSDRIAGELMDYFDEMIGWRDAAKAERKHDIPRKTSVESHAEINRETNEVRHRNPSEGENDPQLRPQNITQTKQPDKARASKKLGHPGFLTMGIMFSIFSLVWIQLYFLEDEPVTPKTVIGHCVFIALAVIMLTLFKKGVGGK